jgi:hypothetical protein
VELQYNNDGDPIRVPDWNFYEHCAAFQSDDEDSVDQTPCAVLHLAEVLVQDEK